ncbi:hypothetical protein AAF712_013068 [Marasmius tenuissimus]|uniref:chitin synthase n=1 Tax=Marasmius tenuissimus TaxID=585030 RepID=A0ABR2ZFY7_9AGAR
MTDIIYTNIGSSCLVAFNPHKYVASNADSVLHKYAAEYRNTTLNKELQPPHIFQLANNAYYHMKRTTQDQAIVFSGEAVSGIRIPSSGYQDDPRALRFQSREGRFQARQPVSQVPAADFALESFANARTLFNPNGSRFGKYTGLQFSDRGPLTGAKTLECYLEKNRVAGAPSGERNFHIFYYLVAGASQEERAHLHLDDKRQDPRKPASSSPHSSNLEFTVDRYRNEDAAVVRNTDVCGIVADFLGVQQSELKACLSYKSKLVKKEMCTVFLDLDELAKSLYSLLFAWLNGHINQRLCKDDFSTDLPPQPSTSSVSTSPTNVSTIGPNENSLNPTSPITYFDNTECVRLLQNKPGGLVHIMDDQAKRALKKTNYTMVEAFQKRWGNHSSFDCSGYPTFTVHHFNGPVTYSSENFLERNQHELNSDLVSVLRGGAGNAGAVGVGSGGGETGGSINPFVKALFSGKAIAMQVHPRNEETIVGAQQNVKPMRAPSMRRKGTIRRMPTVRESADTMVGEESPFGKDDEAATKPGGCVAGEFRAALDTLFETLDEAQAWHVFCVNPNDSQLPNQLEGRSVKGQVRSFGLAEIAKRCGVVFEVNMTPDEFCERYGEGMAEVGVMEGTEKERVQQARTAFGLESMDIVLGNQQVYLSQAAFHLLEDQLRSRDVEEQKRNRLRDAEAEAGLGPRALADPYAPYHSPGLDAAEGDDPWAAGYGDAFNPSSQQLPLVSNASPFIRADQYDDEYDENRSLRSEDDRSRMTSQRDDSASNFGSESYAPSRNMFHNAEKAGLANKEALPGEVQEGETTEVVKESSARRRWVALCWILTWWLPNPCLTYIGRMKRLDVRQAWREKLALNMMIWFACGCSIFVIAVLGLLICPTQHVYSTTELAGHSFQNNPDNVMTAIRGEVFDLTKLSQFHQRAVPVIEPKKVLAYGGKPIDDMFPMQISAVCDGINGNLSPFVSFNPKNNSDPNALYHDFRSYTNDSRPDWYYEQMITMRYLARVGFVGYSPKEIKNMAHSSRSVGVYNGLIYDVTDYIKSSGSLSAPNGEVPPEGASGDRDFMHSAVIDIFRFNSDGGDITKQLNNLNIDSAILARQKTCLRNIFTIGKVDNRNSAQCQFATYILLAISIIMISVIGFKFLASINFGSPRAPEDHDKFVICQVPCYTEGDSSLRKTIDSLAQLKYDDKRKLLVVICDGMIVGSGNDRPTPRIVLDILGADPNLDPEPLSFVLLGEGAKQHNMGKVYSGLYECSGHVVPYLVVAKVGKPNERSRPGNRGKRDSQMVVMHFLNKVHFNAPMNPLELEMYHQIKNVIGVNPNISSLLMPIRPSTSSPLTVSSPRMLYSMIHDKKLLGACGETELANAKQSIITMMQVYEYFISHHMAKASESLFGSVTCLPGCFTLYRLRTPDTHKPLLISNQVIQDYSENRVDTLHMKNLLHLGEDRYLTTLLLKHFPLHKTQFVRGAHAYTVAPDDWKVLLSQRRRWINSTVHNLGELIFLDQLCGFCCFSMRFVVMIDLISTLIQPVTVVYLTYLIVNVARGDQAVPVQSLIMLAAIYGLQALVFILRWKWDMIGWMLFYILAIPAFTFFLPLYSFWRMDDFSWGQTRLVLGESGKKMIVHDEGKFDPRAIPLKSWSDYENELWDKESNHSIGSWVPPTKFKNDGYAESHTASIYGRETIYHGQGGPFGVGQERSYSPAPSQGIYPPPGYQSGRNTPMSQYGMPAPMTPFGAPQTSMLHQPTPSRPGSNYLDLPFDSRSPNASPPGMPSDAEIENAVRGILSNVDLNTVTKRELRRQLEEHFGMDLTAKKGVINQAVDRCLAEQA